MKTIIKNGIVISMDNTKDKYIQEDVVIENDKIIYVGNNYQKECDKTIDATGKIVMPGLINCHTHLGMSLFRATNDNYSLNKWLNDFIWPIENNLTADDIYHTTILSLIEMIKTGTTCFNDMYINYKGSMKAFNEIPVRGIYGECLMGDIDDEGQRRINNFKQLYNTNKNKLINLSIAPHALYTTSINYLKECEKLATAYKLPIHIHLSENMNEVKEVTEKYNMKPVQVLEEAGFLKHKLILAHGTFISDEEINMIKDKNISICTNPISNLNLGCGIADIRKYIDNGINICLGTDGAGSGNNLNMFYHMSLLDNLQKGKYQDPTIMSSYEVLKIATINGAKALGLDKEIGSIETGKKADIIILDLNDIEVFPCINPIIQVVHNAWYNNVDTTIINGNILMENKKLKINIDPNNLKEKIIDIRERLM